MNIDEVTANRFRLCSSICGTAVENLEEEQIGTIADVVLDAATGEAIFAIVLLSTTPNSEFTLIGIPWSAFINRGVDEPSVPYLVDLAREQVDAFAICLED